MARRWTISSNHGPGGAGGINFFRVVLLELRHAGKLIGLGESAPSTRYSENVETVQQFLSKVDANRLSLDDIGASMAYLDSIASANYAAKCAVNVALMDAVSRRAQKPLYDYLGLGFTENKHITSFSIGLDTPNVVREKVAEAQNYPVLKLKVGSPDDRANLAALREVSPTKPIRVDANEAWATKEEALRNLDWLGADGHVQFIEQPMPASTPQADLAWLKHRSPIPIMADESYLSANDVHAVAECFHMVNVKLVKTAGVTGAQSSLLAAREAGLKTMLGCMLETSVLISAAMHLAELCDYLDLDGNILAKNDPYEGPTSIDGKVSFASAKEKFGLRVRERG